jgi:hypothetical protein
MQRVIDWKLATTVAEGIAGLKAAADATPFEHVAGPAEESARLVSGYTGLQAETLPHPEPVDRPLWIESNLTSLRTVLDPVADRLGGAGDVLEGGGVRGGLEAGDPLRDGGGELPVDHPLHGGRPRSSAFERSWLRRRTSR